MHLHQGNDLDSLSLSKTWVGHRLNSFSSNSGEKAAFCFYSYNIWHSILQKELNAIAVQFFYSLHYLNLEELPLFPFSFLFYSPGILDVQL